MGWLKKVLGLKRVSAERSDPPPAVPPIFTTLGPESVHVGYRDGNRDVLTTRDMYEFQFGLATGDAPRQRDLADHFARTDRVVLRSTGMSQGRAMSHEVIVDTTDRLLIDSLADTLRIREEEGLGSRCPCVGGPTIMLYANAELIATIGVQHGKAIRWSRWLPDAPLANGAALIAWLQAREIEPALLKMLLENGYDSGLSDMGYQLPTGRPLSLPEQRLRVIEVHRARGQDNRVALVAVSEVLASDPSVALGAALSALINLELREYELVLQHCTRAKALGLTDTRLLYASAVACHALGRLDEGIRACDEALAHEPGNAAVLNSRGALRLDLGLTQEAFADFDEARCLLQRWYLPLLNRARARIALGDHDAARQDLDEVLSMLASPRSHDEEAGKELALSLTEQIGRS